MDRGNPRRKSGFNSRQLRRPDRIGNRPDRLALWAVVLAVVAMCAAAASADAGASTAKPGGAGVGGGGAASEVGCENSRFGARELREGDCGSDVKTLNWILNSKEFGVEAGLGQEFDSATEAAVTSLQEVAELPSSGIVDEETRDAVIASMRKDTATWYGPGFYGNTTACGIKLTRTVVGVAHKTLPCGSKVTIKYRGRYLRTRVIDRGPSPRESAGT